MSVEQRSLDERSCCQAGLIGNQIRRLFHRIAGKGSDSRG